MKLIFGMKEVGDDIISVYGSSGSKCIKGGVGVIFWDNVGWDVSINVCASVDNDFVDEVVSGNDRWAKLKVEDEFYSENDSSVSKDVKM